MVRRERTLPACYALTQPGLESVAAEEIERDLGGEIKKTSRGVVVFRVDDICIAHLGDLGHILGPDQLKMMGKIDILLVPIAGGYYTVTATEAREVTKQVNPKIAIPMHFWWEQAVQEYTQGVERVKMFNSPALKISEPQLPQPTQTIVMPWGQR